MRLNEQQRSRTFWAKKFGAAIFDGSWVLRPRSAVSLFIRQLTGKKQALDSLSFGFRSPADIYALV